MPTGFLLLYLAVCPFADLISFYLPFHAGCAVICFLADVVVCRSAQQGNMESWLYPHKTGDYSTGPAALL